MKNTFKLLGVTARGILGINKVLSGGRDEKRRALFKVVGFAALLILIGSMLFGMYYSMADALNAIGEAQAVLSMAIVGASVLTLFDVFFRTTNVLFSFKDYDIVMALPVNSYAIVTSRVMSMYIFELLFSCMMTVPAFIAYCTLVSLDAVQYALFVLMLITVPLIPIAVGMIPGILIGMLTSRMKNKNIMNIVFSLLFVAAYMFFYYNFMQSDMLSNMSPETAFSIGSSIQSVYPPSMWFAGGLSGAYVYALLFIMTGILAIVVMTTVISAGFRKLHDMITAQKTSKNYKLRSVKRSSPFKALYKREWKMYLSSSPYVMNTFFGNVLVLAAGILAVIFRDTISDVLLFIPADFSSKLYIAAAFFIASLVTASTLSSVTISIEGKHMWTLTSLPVSAWTVLGAKLFFSMHIGLIVSVVSSVLIVIALGADIITSVLMILIPILFTAASSTFGLFVNLHIPKFDWKNEMQAVKQSASVLIVNVVGMFVGMGFMIVLLFTEIDAVLSSCVFLGAITLFTVWMLISLKTKSTKLMLALSEK